MSDLNTKQLTVMNPAQLKDFISASISSGNADAALAALTIAQTRLDCSNINANAVNIRVNKLATTGFSKGVKTPEPKVQPDSSAPAA